MKDYYTTLVKFNHPIKALTFEERVAIVEHICNHTVEGKTANLQPHQIDVISSLPLDSDRTTVEVKWRANQ